MLFLSRIESAKGIYIVLETLNILNKNENKFKLIIAGSGTEEIKIKKIILGNPDIEWAGYSDGKSKHRLLSSSHIMFFPTCYAEGMPLTILEGMMYGLPIISRPMGGIPDIVINKENGYILKSIKPEDFADKINILINNPELYNKISQKNINKSLTFYPAKVRERIYSLYEKVYDET